MSSDSSATNLPTKERIVGQVPYPPVKRLEIRLVRKNLEKNSNNFIVIYSMKKQAQ